MKKIKDTNTESHILDAAKQIFQTKGMDGARMQEIADKAGINKAMLHYYFRNKQLLFEAVFNQAFAMIAPQLKAVMNDDSSIEEKIKNFTYNYTSFMLQHPYLPNFIIQELNRNEEFLDKLKANSDFPNLKKFKLKVQQEIAQGLIQPIDADQLFVNILSLNIFPFLGKPLIKAFTNNTDTEHIALVEKRKTEVAEFIINSIKRN